MDVVRFEPGTGHSAETEAELGDLLVSYLEQLGVEYVFGIPGGAIEPLYNALARSERRGGPRAIVARHETGAAFMADGYARNSGKLGVCCATTGPGATNLITGVASAYENNVPMSSAKDVCDDKYWHINVS
jgi:acetolactate synthase-1/2/3 large subunit